MLLSLHYVQGQHCQYPPYKWHFYSNPLGWIFVGCHKMRPVKSWSSRLPLGPILFERFIVAHTLLWDFETWNARYLSARIQYDGSHPSIVVNQKGNLRYKTFLFRRKNIFCAVKCYSVLLSDEKFWVVQCIVLNFSFPRGKKFPSYTLRWEGTNGHTPSRVPQTELNLQLFKWRADIFQIEAQK